MDESSSDEQIPRKKISTVKFHREEANVSQEGLPCLHRACHPPGAEGDRHGSVPASKWTQKATVGAVCVNRDGLRDGN